jgi:UDP-4-amino-4,6-dideoxy-L-N-acetyl-beta-L-altrosamine transaminase
MQMKVNIPYGHQSISEEDISEVVKVLKADFLTTGPKTTEFEKSICMQVGAKYSVVVSSGTAALHLASLCLLNKGDIVLTTPNSFLATSNTILYAEAIPQFVDIQKDGNIDLDLCENELKKNPDIKAIYVVHFSGNPVDQEKLAYLKKTYGVKILEDCAHSIGAYSYSNKGQKIRAGDCMNSDCSILSFHPVKLVTTGEGGAITTNNLKIYEKLLLLRNHGMVRDSSKMLYPDFAEDKNGKPNAWYYEMQMLGFNYRITDFQCALGASQLKRLPSFLARRHEIAKKYDLSLSNHLYIKPLYTFSDNSSYHLYVVKIDFDKLKINRSDLFHQLFDAGIRPQVHYLPINKQPFYQNLGYGNELTPEMDRYYDQCLSLPIYPDLQDSEQEYVISRLMSFLV